MNSSETKPVGCDPEIYRDGKCVALIAGGSAKEIESFVKEVALVTGEPIDWHYVAGRARVLTTGDVVKVREQIMLSESGDMVIA